VEIVISILRNHKGVRTMLNLRNLSIAGTLAGACLGLAPATPALAGPTNLAQLDTYAPHFAVMDVRYRRVARRSNGGIGPAAVLGMFGAIVGTVIANDRYNNYNNYSYHAYGRSDDYGYRRDYGPRRIYVPGNYPSGYGVYQGW
jgi:hypothetical protein